LKADIRTGAIADRRGTIQTEGRVITGAVAEIWSILMNLQMGTAKSASRRCTNRTGPSAIRTTVPSAPRNRRGIVRLGQSKRTWRRGNGMIKNKNNRSMGSHQSAKMITDEWLTPPWLLNRLGEFDLDPCSPVNRPWPTAKCHFTIIDDGLLKKWNGRVWCNPPYGNKAAIWLSKCAEHGNAVALIFARTETKMFFNEVWKKADAVLFLNGRLFFHHPTGMQAKSNSGAPSVLVAYGSNNAKCLKNSGISGAFIESVKVL
jgi:hypothetical protein